MTDDLEAQLALARELHARFVPKKGRRARRRLGGQDLLRVARLVSDDPELLAALELEFRVRDWRVDVTRTGPVSRAMTVVASVTPRLPSG